VAFREEEAGAELVLGRLAELVLGWTTVWRRRRVAEQRGPWVKTPGGHDPARDRRNFSGRWRIREVGDDLFGGA
jgi:hypothetical protein